MKNKFKGKIKSKFKKNNPKNSLFEQNDKEIFVLDETVKMKRILTDWKGYLTLAVFVFVCITVVKTSYWHKKADEYEEFFTVIEEKDSKEMVIDTGQEIADEQLFKKGAAAEMTSCLNTKLDKEKLPDSIVSIINEIKNYYNQSNNYFSFAYKDLYTGFTVTYNENQPIFTASTIKAPIDIYLYEMASTGKIDLTEKLKYTGNYYNTGSGVLKNKQINTTYDVKTLIEYSIVYSDNAAHNMLMDHFGRDKIRSFWQERGTSVIFTVNNNWGITNSHDALIYMSELYRFYLENEEYGKPLMNNFLNAKTKFIKGVNKYPVANKSGWSGSAIHDVSIIFADNPYIVVALSNLGDKSYSAYFNKANELAFKLHNEYWKYKMNECNKINQFY